MERSENGEPPDGSMDVNGSFSRGHAEILNTGAQDDAVAAFDIVDEFEKLDALARSAGRRRKIALGLALGFAAVAAPFVTLLLTGRFSLANFHQAARSLAPARHVRPTPIPLTAEERNVLAANIAIDLHDYAWIQMPPSIHEEKIAEHAFDSVTNSNYESDKISYETIRNVVVPHYTRFVSLAASIRPKTRELQILHHLMLTSARLKLMGFKGIAGGEGDQDRLWRIGVNACFAESTRRSALYRQGISGLARATQTKLP